MDDILLDSAMKSLDPNAQQVIVNAATQYVNTKQSAAPTAVAPASAGRVSDEQVPAPVDALKLLNTTTDAAATVYDVEISYGGNIDHVGVALADDGSVQVRPVE